MTGTDDVSAPTAPTVPTGPAAPTGPSTPARPAGALTPAEITAVRTVEPHRIAERLATRPQAPPWQDPDANMLIIAADHPARGSLAAGANPHAMADRSDLIARVATALARPNVHGFLGTADLIEELALIGALDGKIVFGSMNRGGLAGADFEVDDRFTGYDARGIVESRLDGGKMLLRIDPADPATPRTMEACARAVDDLADARRIAMVEPFLAERETAGSPLRNVLTPEAVITSIVVASGLGRTSAYTWLKLPVVDDMERVMASTTLPAMILGGEVAEDTDAARSGWAAALQLPNVKGLMIGRSLLYPPDDDVAAAVDAAVELL